MIKRIRKSPANTLNVCVVSMQRCGVSAVGVVLSDIHEGIYGVPIDFNYVEDPITIMNEHPKGWHTIYNVNPYLIEFYDKILVIKRNKKDLWEDQLEYGIAQARVDKRELHPIEIERLHDTFDWLYPQLYEHPFEEEKFFLLLLEHFNKYTEKTLEALCEWLEFDMRGFKKHIVLIPIKVERDWSVYSTRLTPTQKVCQTLKMIEVIHDE